MNYESHQSLAKHNTGQLVFYLALGSLGLVLSLTAAVSAYFYVRFGAEVGNKVAITTASLTFIGILMASIARAAQIRHGGGELLAASLGGLPINTRTHDQAERQLVNIVEEIAIASGLPVPRMFVLVDEQGINAFTAGWNADNAVIGVTRGALVYLTRDELQAVVAHEFSHIANGDMVVKTKVIGWVYGIGTLSTVGAAAWRTLLRPRHHEPDPGLFELAFALVGTVLMFFGSIGGYFARLIQAAVNRERELLADASAIEYTRNLEGLTGALMKIGALGETNQLRARRVAEVSHLFFDAPLRQSTSSHPPLRRRIAILNPAWDRTYPTHEAVVDGANHDIAISHLGMPLPDIFDVPGKVMTADQMPPVPGIDALGPQLASVAEAAIVVEALGFDQPKNIPTEGVVVGPPTGRHLTYARQLLTRIPDETKDYLHSQEGAVAAVLGLLASPNPEFRASDFSRASDLSGFPAEYLESASSVIGNLDQSLRLPAIDLALSSIRQTSTDFHSSMRETIAEFTSVSPDADLFRWMLRRVVMRHLEDLDDHGESNHNLAIATLQPQAALVYAAFAAYNSSGHDRSVESFLAAHAAAGLPEPTSMPLDRDITVGRLDDALDDLSHMSYRSRQAFITGAVAAVELDSTTSADEAELIRVIADAVRLPIPPILPVALPDALKNGLAA